MIKCQDEKSQSLSMTGKIAIVIGADREIGREIVGSFAQAGATVYACAGEESDEFNKYMTQIAEKTGVCITPVYFDCGKPEEIKDGMNRIINGEKKIDVLVNNGGREFESSLNMITIEELDRVFQMNFFTPVLLMQFIGNKMMRQEGGAIINISSVSGIQASPGYFSYGTCEAALIHATRIASKELGKHNIRVNAVATGMKKTDKEDAFTIEGSCEGLIQDLSLERMNESKEIAKIVLFLASDKASFITGSVLTVDGGRS